MKCRFEGGNTDFEALKQRWIEVAGTVFHDLSPLECWHRTSPDAPARLRTRCGTKLRNRLNAERQFLPNLVFAAATQLLLASPARASHFSMATL